MESPCLFQACALVLETSCHAAAHTISLSFSLFLNTLIALMLHRRYSDMVKCVCLCTLQIKDSVIEAKVVTGSLLILLPWSPHQQSEQLRSAMMTKDNNGELFCAVLPLVTHRSSVIRHFLYKIYPPALMGRSILIWLHKKKNWAFILFRKQHSSFTKSFLSGLAKGRESSGLPSCSSVHRYFSIQELWWWCFL